MGDICVGPREFALTNVEQLEHAGLIQTHNPLTPEEAETVNNLSSAEVEALISVKAKLGDKFFQRKVQDGDCHRMGTLIV
jgi:hypothetical protein